MIKRYTLPEMGSLWVEDAKFGRWLAIELAVCREQARRGKIPRKDLKRIERKAGFSVARIDHHEKRTNHDVLAFLAAVSERVGPSARFIHMGLTSYDVVDTGLGIAMRDAANLLEIKLRKYAAELKRLAALHRDTVITGRTHGVQEISREENLKHTAVFRLALGHTVTNLQASWVKMGLDAATEALSWGVNDLGGTLMEESISRMAGSYHGVRLEPDDLIGAAHGAGRPAAERTTLYEIRRRYEQPESIAA